MKNVDTLEKYNSLSIKDSYEFIKAIKYVEIQEDEMMVSFDVTSRYPSVPFEKALELVKKWLEENGLEEGKVLEFIRLIKLCTNQKFMQFNQKFYEQEFGLTMGGTLSTILADIFMSSLETKGLNQHK